MKKRWSFIPAVLVAMVIMVMGGCGGGGSSGSGSEKISNSISGTVTVNGVGLSGVTVTLSGSGSSTATTDSNGNYNISSVQNGSYTVTPSLTGYTFSLVNQSVTVNGVNATGNDFTATATTANSYSISGMITSGGVALAGVTVSTSGGSATTDASGNYTISGLANGSYTVTTAKSGYAFTPASLAVTVSGANVTGKNFSADVAQSGGYSISGTIHSGSNSGPALSGATVSIAGKTTTTSGTGAFSIAGIPTGTYAFSVFKSGYDTYTNPAYYVGSNQVSLNFYLTPPPGPTYSISGTIHTASNSGPALPGATVSIAGRTATTSSTGAFLISGIPPRTYAFSVSKSGYETYTNPAYYVGSNQIEQNFYITAINSSLICPPSRGTSINGIQFTGSTSYQLSTTAANATGTATLTWEVYYQNTYNLPTGSYSGSLRAQLWAVPYSFSGGTITNSYVIGIFSPNFTGPGAYSSNQVYVGSYSTSPISSSVSRLNPPAGTYCIVATIDEFNSTGGCSDPDGYCYDQWIQYAAPVTFR